MTNILEVIKAHISPELLLEASKIYGETETGISKTIASIAPTILLGLLEKSGDSHELHNIFNTIRNFDSGILNNLNGLLGEGNSTHQAIQNTSGQVLGVIFGAKMPAIVNAVASFSGVKASTASALTGLAGPLVMGILSQKINTDGLRASGFVSLLLHQRPNIVSMLPAGVGALLGAVNIGNGNRSANENSMGAINWIWPALIALVGLVAVLYYFLA